LGDLKGEECESLQQNLLMPVALIKRIKDEGRNLILASVEHLAEIIG
jgi:hypothetical protein